MSHNVAKPPKSSLYIEVVSKSRHGYKRLFWVRESNNQAGIRFGFIAKDVYGGHMTFYKGGHSHIESKAGILSEFDYIIPSNSDDDFYIMGQSVVQLRLSKRLETQPKLDNVIMVDESSLGESVWVDLYLAKAGREEKAIEQIFDIGLTKAQHLIRQEIIQLSYVENHSLILMIANEK